MDREALRSRWLAAEENAHIIGWDFSWMDGHYTQPDTPWSLRDIITAHLQPGHRLLDMETGGGEFLLSLGHPPQKIAATEAYPPNVQLCRERLAPLGVDFRPARGDGPLPFDDSSFDVVINRHGSFDPKEVYRVLKPGGLFITQQVGGMNDHGLVELLIPGQNRSHSDFNARNIAEDFRRAGFTVIEAGSGEEALACFKADSADNPLATSTPPIPTPAIATVATAIRHSLFLSKLYVFALSPRLAFRLFF